MPIYYSRWSTADCSHANCAVPHTRAHTLSHFTSLTQTSTWQSAYCLHVSRDELLVQLGQKHRDDPVRVTRERTDWVWAPPRLASIIRGHQLLCRAYRRFDTLRSSSPAQPYFYHIPALFGSPHSHCACRQHGSLDEDEDEDEERGLANLGTRYARSRTQGADQHGRSLRPWPVAPGKEATADLSQNTHGLGCYMPPPSCPSTSAASPPAAGHHSPWRLSPYAVFPSLLRACTDTMPSHPLLIFPFEPDGLAGRLLSRLQLG